MEWFRGDLIGHGSFGSVNLAILRNGSPLAAVKSCAASNSASLRREIEVLTVLGDSPQIIRCLGGCSSYENGESLFNVFMEYADGGNLADRVRSHAGGGLQEMEIRRYTRSILEGISHIHRKGFVHCDLKLRNVLLCSSETGGDDEFDVKIADFGLAKGAGENRGFEIRGTPLYMSPESVNSGEYGPPADVWALGCAVAEMFTGEPPWRCGPGCDVTQLLFRIGGDGEFPEVPQALSEQGRDFLGKCFVKDPTKRWTAEMLLDHPFVIFDGSDGARTVPFQERTKEDEEPSISPRGPFEFPEWVAGKCSHSLRSQIPAIHSTDSARSFPGESGSCDSSWSLSAGERIRQLATEEKPNWSVTDSWVTAR